MSAECFHLAQDFFFRKYFKFEVYVNAPESIQQQNQSRHETDKIQPKTLQYSKKYLNKSWRLHSELWSPFGRYNFQSHWKKLVYRINFSRKSLCSGWAPFSVSSMSFRPCTKSINWSLINCCFWWSRSLKPYFFPSKIILDSSSLLSISMNTLSRNFNCCFSKLIEKELNAMKLAPVLDLKLFSQYTVIMKGNSILFMILKSFQNEIVVD